MPSEENKIYSFSIKGTTETIEEVLDLICGNAGLDLELLGGDLRNSFKSRGNDLQKLEQIQKVRKVLFQIDHELESAEEIYSSKLEHFLLSQKHRFHEKSPQLGENNDSETNDTK